MIAALERVGGQLGQEYSLWIDGEATRTSNWLKSTSPAELSGKRAGLSGPQAALLAKQSCLGAGRMLVETNDPPDVLREKVTSPGGTTAAAIASLRENGVFDHVVEAVLAAYERSKELG